jgi:hypothetical protein
MILSWHIKWLVGAVSPLVLYALTRRTYFKADVPFFSLIVPENFASLYKGLSAGWWKANAIYTASLYAAYLGLYVLISLVTQKISKAEASVHLILWTLIPPMWFAFERYCLFDDVGEDRIKMLKEGQEYASKLWSAVLAVLLAFKLGEIIKG